MSENVEVQRLQDRLNMILGEFMRLQETHRELSTAHERLQAASGQSLANTFTGRLLNQVADMYGKERYSDMRALLTDSLSLPVHRFVLRARGSTNSWNGLDLEVCTELNVADLPAEVARGLLKWVYTDHIKLQDKDDRFLIGLLTAAHRFGLDELRDECERVIMPSVTVANCIKYYQLAENLLAEKLRDHCGKVISAHWTDFSSADFADMPAGLLLDMFYKETKFPLHASVRTGREDVVFLYLTKTTQLSTKLNVEDDRGSLALDLALTAKSDGIISSLLDYGADINVLDSEGRSLLHRAVDRADSYSCTYLLEHGVDVTAQVPSTRQSVLHLLAVAESSESLSGVGELAVMRGAPVNCADWRGQSPLHLCVLHDNVQLLQVLLAHPSLDTELRDAAGDSALWLALSRFAENGEQLSSLLLQKGASPDGACAQHHGGDCLLQRCVRLGNEEAAAFLVNKGADLKHLNNRGESLLHTSCRHQLPQLTKTLLSMGADPNVQMSQLFEEDEETARDLAAAAAAATSASASNSTTATKPKSRSNSKVKSSPAPPPVSSNALGNPFGNPFDDDDEEEEEEEEEEGDGEEEEEPAVVEEEELEESESLGPVTMQTPLHVAIGRGDSTLVQVFLDHKLTHSTGAQAPNLTLRDSRGNTAFSLALWNGLFSLADQLHAVGVALDERNSQGRTLLHQAICLRNAEAALFLMNHGADINAVTADNASPLQLAIRKNLPGVVDALCQRGADKDFMDHRGDCPLWLALQQNHLELAEILVRRGCDVTGWGPARGLDGATYEQTLLFRAINENNEDVADFLVRHGADVNSPRRPPQQGNQKAAACEEASDGLTPLHVAAAAGMETVVQSLIENNADVNRQDDLNGGILTTSDVDPVSYDVRIGARRVHQHPNTFHRQIMSHLEHETLTRFVISL